MPEKTKILLIENQFRQYKVLAILLQRKGYQVFPDMAEYISFLNNIRIYLNDRYGGLKETGKRTDALKRINEFIEKNGPDIFIVDHVLVGYHQGQNGIFLMETLRALFKQPILFLSRTSVNDEKVMENLPKIDQPRRWINKGYFGEEILDKNYLEKHVVRAIEELTNNAFDVETKTLILEVKSKDFGEQDPATFKTFKDRLHRYLTDQYISQNDLNQVKIIHEARRILKQHLADFLKAIDKYEL